MMKKIVLSVTLVATLMATGVSAQSPQDIRVNVNDVTVQFPDAKPYVASESNRTMVPVRFIAEELGSHVSWDQDSQKVMMTKDGKSVVLTIGEKKALVDGKSVAFDANAALSQNRTYVPLRFVSEAFGAKVEWLAAEKVVEIKTGSASTVDTNLPTKPVKWPTREGQVENVEAMKRMVATFKVENGVLTGKVAPDVKGYVLISFIPENKSMTVANTDFLKPNESFTLKLTDDVGHIQLGGQDGTSFGTVGIEYPSMKIIHSH